MVLDYVMATLSYLGIFVISMHFMWDFTSMDVLEMIVCAAVGSLIAYIPGGIKAEKRKEET